MCGIGFFFELTRGMRRLLSPLRIAAGYEPAAGSAEPSRPEIVCGTCGMVSSELTVISSAQADSNPPTWTPYGESGTLVTYSSPAGRR